MLQSLDTDGSVRLAPTPKVPASAWRWPPAWPFPDDFMVVLSPQTGVGGGFDAQSIGAIQGHLDYFMEDGSSVLEIGAVVDSVLPPNKSFGNSVGVRMVERALTNAGGMSVETELLDECGKLPFESGTFDYVVLSSGIEYVKNPQDLLCDVLRVLKAGGKCFTAFSSKGLEETLSPLKMWTTMNDEQKIWIAGAYYHYAGGDGYQKIEGYDLLGGAEEGAMVFSEKSDDSNEQAVYCVQAQKIELPPVEMTYNYTMAALAGARNMDKDDCNFISLRAEGGYSQATTDAERSAVTDNLNKFPEIYEILKDVKEVVIPKPIKAMLATFLAAGWTNTDAEKQALRMSTGLETPSEEFWKPLGLATASMEPRDKINFLADTVTLFGKPEKAGIISNYPTVLSETIELIKTKVPEADIGDVQLLATDLSSTDYLSGSSSQDRFTRFLQQAPPSFYTEQLAKRKAVW